VFQVDTECWESVTQGGEQMTKREPNSLTNEEIQEFAIELLQGGNTHIYELALSLYSVDVDDDLLPKLKEIGGIYRCQECDQWKRVVDYNTEYECCPICVDLLIEDISDIDEDIGDFEDTDEDAVVVELLPEPEDDDWDV
jgi:hypothetical protein